MAIDQEERDYWILDDYGTPIKVYFMQYVNWMAESRQQSRRRVANSHFPAIISFSGEVLQYQTVSTVFVGGTILWESLVFNGLHDGVMIRVDTLEQAQQAHARLCTWIKNYIVYSSGMTESNLFTSYNVWGGK